MKQIAFLLILLHTAQVYSQNQTPSWGAPGTITHYGLNNAQNDSNTLETDRLEISEIGVTFGQDFVSGDKGHMYLESRLGMSYGNNLWTLIYGLSNPWDFSIGGSPNVGNTNILSGSYGQKLNLFQGIETEVYLGLSYLNVKTEEGNETFWGLPLTVVLDKPIFNAFSIGLVGQLQPTTKKGRALIGLKLSYGLNP